LLCLSIESVVSSDSIGDHCFKQDHYLTICAIFPMCELTPSTTEGLKIKDNPLPCNCPISEAVKD